MTHPALRALPPVLRIGAYDVPIRVASGLLSLDTLDGVYEPSTREIGLGDHLTDPRRIVEATIHELTHALYHSQNIHEADGEERTVTALGVGWTQVYRDNPELLKWLTRWSK